MAIDSKFAIGATGEMLAMEAFCAAGARVCVPFGDASVYDFIADYNGRLYRVQVKARKTNSSRVKYFFRHQRSAKYKVSEIDYLCMVNINRRIVSLYPYREDRTSMTLNYDEITESNVAEVLHYSDAE